jgi:hypothetical protein
MLDSPTKLFGFSLRNQFCGKELIVNDVPKRKELIVNEARSRSFHGVPNQFYPPNTA